MSRMPNAHLVGADNLTRAAAAACGSGPGRCPARPCCIPVLEDLARIAKEAEGIVTELRAALETESGLLKSLNEKLAALHA